jgi:3-deoxy-7-phosphoheptulonate synthase
LEPDELVRLLDIVDPDREPGRITLICRYGADKVRRAYRQRGLREGFDFGFLQVEKFLPLHIKAVQASEHPAIFACDPMHGNTRTSESRGDIKTRHMGKSLSSRLFNALIRFYVFRIADIVSELSASIRIHTRLGSRLGGVHLEMTGEVNEDGYSVTECLGGSMELQDEELSKNYQVISS